MKLASTALALLLILGLTACSDDDTKKTIEIINVDNGGQTVVVGGTTKVTLTATYTDGTTEDFSNRAEWTTQVGSDGMDASAFGTVDGAGTVTGVSVGTYEVVADVNITDGDGSINPYSGRFTIGFDTTVPTTGDSGTPDSSTPDSSTPDSSTSDAGPTDGGATDGGADDAATGDAATGDAA